MKRRRKFVNLESNGNYSSIEFEGNGPTGTYFDFLACGLSYSHRPIRSALLLGASGGVMLRTVLSIPSVKFVSCVDVKNCTAVTSLAKQESNRGRVLLHRVDAMCYLENVGQKFDVLILDLYDSDGYAPCMTSSRLYRLLSSCLTLGGVCVVHCFDFPNFLSPQRGWSATASVGAQLQYHFESVKAIADQRNTLFVASNLNLLSIEKQNYLDTSTSSHRLNAILTGVAKSGLSSKSVSANSTSHPLTYSAMFDEWARRLSILEKTLWQRFEFLAPFRGLNEVVQFACPSLYQGISSLESIVLMVAASTILDKPQELDQWESLVDSLVDRGELSFSNSDSRMLCAFFRIVAACEENISGKNKQRLERWAPLHV